MSRTSTYVRPTGVRAHQSAVLAAAPDTSRSPITSRPESFDDQGLLATSAQECRLFRASGGKDSRYRDIHLHRILGQSNRYSDIDSQNRMSAEYKHTETKTRQRDPVASTLNGDDTNKTEWCSGMRSKANATSECTLRILGHIAP